jgi:hypothetical protein
VAWQGYESAHRPTQRAVFTVDEFFDGLQEYQDRLGAWRKGARQALHTRYGHMADRTRSKTAAQIGGQPRAHRENCPCMECGRPWYRVFLDDDGNERGHLRDLAPPEWSSMGA